MKNILIAGGGIGGLTTALTLARSGYVSTVLERATKFDNLGAGIQCGANAINVLDWLGLRDKLESVAVKPKSLEFRDYQSGKILYHVPLGVEYEQRYGAPYLHLERSRLHEILVEAVTREYPNVLRLGVDVSQVRQNQDGVEVIDTSGNPYRCAGFVAADGVRSRFSTVSHQPLFTGHIAWRGLVPVDSIQGLNLDKVATNFVGPGKHFVAYYVAGGELLNFVAVEDSSSAIEESWFSRRPTKHLQASFSGWHPTVERILAAITDSECDCWALYDHRPLPSWSDARITLLGDAAHATLPFMASGAALAIEDAMVLARSLRHCENVIDAFSLYEKNRIKRCSKVQTNSRQFGRLYHIKNNWLRHGAFRALRWMPAEKENFLPSYNATSIPLTS
ncbi:MAG: FAD-dependent monooxygenase [Pseudomonadota bacterium]